MSNLAPIEPLAFAQLLPPHRFTREEYEEMIRNGIIEEGTRVELLQGYIVDMPVQKPAHSVANELVQHALMEAFGTGFHIRSQKPLALGEDSEPEPDNAVVEGQIRDYLSSHPTTALLIVEVSDSTLKKDQGPKLQTYAMNGIPEYWIVNIPEGQLEVYSEPTGNSYAKTDVLKPGDLVAPLAKPDGAIQVSDLLP